MTDPFQQLMNHPGFREGQSWYRLNFAANKIIIAEGDQGEDIYVILRGRVRIVVDMEVNHELRIRPGIFELEAGEVFGELALFDRGPRSASVIAVSDCLLARIPGEGLMVFLEQNRDIGFTLLKEMMETLVSRCRRTNRKLLSMFAWGLKARGIDEHL